MFKPAIENFNTVAKAVKTALSSTAASAMIFRDRPEIWDELNRNADLIFEIPYLEEERYDEEPQLPQPDTQIGENRGVSAPSAATHTQSYPVIQAPQVSSEIPAEQLMDIAPSTPPIML